MTTAPARFLWKIDMSDTRTRLRHYRLLDSTNAELRRISSEENLAIYADCQTGGRGQRGNVWLSESGRNLLFSMLWHPQNLPARMQFSLSEAAALSVVLLLKDCGVCAQVKWPNDIYVGDSKICGILIENAVGRQLESSIIGVGLNLNQTEFPDTLPNPVSVAKLTGRETNPAQAACKLVQYLEQLLPMSATEAGRMYLHGRYMESLYRFDGDMYPYRDPATCEVFDARLADVELTGHLLLKCADGMRRFAFKEVEFVLPSR